jgi:hypothetical protein
MGDSEVRSWISFSMYYLPEDVIRQDQSRQMWEELDAPG